MNYAILIGCRDSYPGGTAVCWVVMQLGVGGRSEPTVYLKSIINHNSFVIEGWNRLSILKLSSLSRLFQRPERTNHLLQIAIDDFDYM